MNKLVNALLHGIAAIIAFGLPILLTGFPTVANLTIGGALTLIYHMLIPAPIV